jgi:hypothetical protein
MWKRKACVAVFGFFILLCPVERKFFLFLMLFLYKMIWGGPNFADQKNDFFDACTQLRSASWLIRPWLRLGSRSGFSTVDPSMMLMTQR